jgi:hypothetical protein
VHELLWLGIAQGEVLRVQAGPAGLLLGECRAPGVPHDLTHAGVAEQMRVDRRRLAGPTTTRGAQGQHVDLV